MGEIIALGTKIWPEMALNWAQGEMGDSLKKKFFFFFFRIFIKSFHKQALMAI